MSVTQLLTFRTHTPPPFSPLLSRQTPLWPSGLVFGRPSLLLANLQVVLTPPTVSSKPSVLNWIQNFLDSRLRPSWPSSSSLSWRFPPGRSTLSRSGYPTLPPLSSLRPILCFYYFCPKDLHFFFSNFNVVLKTGFSYPSFYTVKDSTHLVQMNSFRVGKWNRFRSNSTETLWFIRQLVCSDPKTSTIKRF